MYLYDQQTSLLVLVPATFGTLVEYWKLTKALRIRRVGWRLYFDAPSGDEQRTAEFDTEGMRYLAYALVPLLIGGAVYR